MFVRKKIVTSSMTSLTKLMTSPIWHHSCRCVRPTSTTVTDVRETFFLTMKVVALIIFKSNFSSSFYKKRYVLNIKNFLYPTWRGFFFFFFFCEGHNPREALIFYRLIVATLIKKYFFRSVLKEHLNSVLYKEHLNSCLRKILNINFLF